MPREIVTGNGQLSVALDRKMGVRDFFYPHVGLENHAGGHVFRFGVQVDNGFRWMGSGEWNIAMKYLPETLVSQCLAVHKELKVELEVNDAVHSFLDVYFRKVAVRNLAEVKREVKVFLSHDFHIYGEDAATQRCTTPVFERLYTTNGNGTF